MTTLLRAVLVVGAVAGLTGCGGGDGRTPDQQPSDRAGFVRAANVICERTNRAVARDRSKPLTEDALALSVISSEHATERGAAKLHKLHADLGDSSSAAIDAFDEAIDPYLATFDALEGAPFADDRTRAAARLRRSGTALYRAARSARLDRCGRGANAIADRAVFLTYRDAYFEIAGRASDRILGAKSLGVRAKLRVFASAFGARQRADRALRPPSHLRSLHEAVQRWRAAVARHFSVLASPSLARRIEAERTHGSDLDRYEQLEARLLRELHLGEGPGEDL